MDIKDTYTSVFLKAAEQPADEETVKKFKPIWWLNFRQKGSGGLRLTEAGLNFIKNHSQIKTYQIEIDKNITLTPQVLVWLDQFIECPFYITKKGIYVFDEKIAVQLVLYSGNIQKYTSIKAIRQSA